MRLFNYFFEGLAVALAAYFIPRRKIDLKEIIIIALTSAAIFSILDMISPVTGMSARQGAGFGIGLNQVGWLPQQGGVSPINLDLDLVWDKSARVQKVNTSTNVNGPSNNQMVELEIDEPVEVFTDSYFGLLMDLIRFSQESAPVRTEGWSSNEQFTTLNKASLLQRAATLVELGRQLPPDTPINFTPEEKSEILAKAGIRASQFPEKMTVRDVVGELEITVRGLSSGAKLTLEPRNGSEMRRMEPVMKRRADPRKMRRMEPIIEERRIDSEWNRGPSYNTNRPVKYREPVLIRKRVSDLKRKPVRELKREPVRNWNQERVDERSWNQKPLKYSEPVVKYIDPWNRKLRQRYANNSKANIPSNVGNSAANVPNNARNSAANIPNNAVNSAANIPNNAVNMNSWA